MLIPLQQIQAARERLSEHLNPTPVQSAASYRRKLGAEVRLKLEFLQPTHSFKVRGALNAMLTLSEEARAHGVVTASGGNHGLGVSYAAKLSETEAVIVLPETTPEVRIEAIDQLGGTVIVHGEDWNAANAKALDLSERRGYTYVSPFDDPAIMAGQGTVALEILEQVPEVEVVVASVGGGGLISGMASAFKQLRPEVRVVGVETRGADCMAQSVAAGRVVELPRFTSIAESLGTRRSTERQLAVVQEAVERMVVVDDRDAVEALLDVLNKEKMLVEPAASCTLAALGKGLVPAIAGRNIVAVMCGANITLQHVMAWTERFALQPFAAAPSRVG